MRKTLLFTGLFMLMAAGAFALDSEELLTGDFSSPTSFDARARGMGHTNILNAVGANSIFYNPANLAFLTNKTFEAGFRVNMFGKVTDDWAEAEAADNNADVSVKLKLHPKLTDFSFGMPIPMTNPNLKLAVGLGYNTHFDWARTIKTEITAKTGSGKYTDEIKYKGGLPTLTPAVSLGIQDKYFFGFAIHKSIMGNVSLKEIETYDPDTDSDNLTQEDKAKISGTFFSFGATAKPTPEFSLGLTFRSGFTEKMTDRKWEDKHVDGTVHTNVYGDIEAKQKAIFGFGASYQVTPEMVIGAEFETRPFLDVIAVTKEGTDNDASVDTSKIKNGLCLRFGGEYKVSPNMPIRLGVFSDAVAIRDEVGTEWWKVEGKPKTATGITGGFGYSAEAISFDFFAEYYSLSFKHDEYLGEALKEYKTKMSQFTIGASFSYSLKM